MLMKLLDARGPQTGHSPVSAAQEHPGREPLVQGLPGSRDGAAWPRGTAPAGNPDSGPGAISLRGTGGARRCRRGCCGPTPPPPPPPPCRIDVAPNARSNRRGHLRSLAWQLWVNHLHSHDGNRDTDLGWKGARGQTAHSRDRRTDRTRLPLGGLAAGSGRAGQGGLCFFDFPRDTPRHNC